jgi:hypothetical protein
MNLDHEAAAVLVFSSLRCYTRLRRRKTMQNRWLRLDKVEPGMFSDELTVVLKRANGDPESFVVPKSAVEQAERRLRVHVREEGGTKWAEIPSPYRDLVPVRASDLV